jgi:hypothetical protein
MRIPLSVFSQKGEKTMFGKPILSRFSSRKRRFRAAGLKRPDLHTAWQQRQRLPDFVRDSPLAQRYLDLLGPLPWDHLPERNLTRNWGQSATPYAAFIAAYLFKLNEGKKSLSDLRVSLLEHPELIWLLGFPLLISYPAKLGFDADASLPTSRHLSRLLREMPNSVLQYLLAASVRLIREELRRHQIEIGECISLDTKHILAWVSENNPKAYVENRYDKTRQPAGDPDCKLGCKRRHNRRKAGSEAETHATPSKNPIPAKDKAVGEFYWGYGSGVVVSKVPGWGEVVLAELTQPFDRADVSYFFPLMSVTEQRLGFRPHFATFDAAFDAWYVYDYFHRGDDPEAFAAVPFSEKGGYKAKGRLFSPEGLPLCTASLPMPLRFTYTDRTTCIVEHERGKYVCPLRYPQHTAESCPVNHKNWEKQGCTATMPTSIGARLRYTLDRDSEAYKAVYKQRTAVERINSQAVALGIERPHIRNGMAIANQNTLIYLLINLHLLQRIRSRQPDHPIELLKN